jgi:SAM-dependent methyltransferase
MQTSSTQVDNPIAYWEKIAKTKWGTYISEIEKCAILESHRLSKKPANALEIGCGGGRWSKLLSDLGWNMICTDVNQQALDICRKKVTTAECVLVSPSDSKLPCDTENIALVLCIEVPPVIQSNWFIHEVFRVLHSKGLVVGVFFNRFSARGSFAHLTSRLSGSFDYYRLSYPAWRRKFCKKGLKILYEKGFCWFPFQRTSNSHLVPIFTRIEACLHLGNLASLSPWVVFIAQKN